MPRGHQWSPTDERLLFGILLTLAGTANFRKAAELLREVSQINVSNEAVHHRFREIKSAYERQLEEVREAASGIPSAVVPSNSAVPINARAPILSNSNIGGSSNPLGPVHSAQEQSHSQQCFTVDPVLWSSSSMQHPPNTNTAIPNPYVTNAPLIAPAPKRKAEPRFLKDAGENASNKRVRRG